MESKMELLLVEDDPSVCESFITQIDDCDDLVLVGVTNNSHKALEYISETLLDAVILELELHQGGGSGLNVLHELQQLPLMRKPYILITTNNSSTATYEAARSLGADYIMSKHQEGYSVAGVLEFLRIMRTVIKNTNRVSDTKNNTTETKEQYNRRIIRHIMAELNYVGVSPKAVGYKYLVDSIQIMMKEPMQNICVPIASKYGKSESSVERAMQNAINRAWKTSNVEDLLCHYTAKINSAKGSPTITEFICYYANKIKAEY
ncbi:MAG: sporulation initiation factor Spo0A C-terminal domain-containing protein [Eubacteriales bacterium]